MSDTPQKTTNFLPIEQYLILRSRGAKDWNSKAANAQPKDATKTEFDIDGPISFESLSQSFTKERRELQKAGKLKNVPTDVYPKDIEAEYNRLRSEHPYDHEEMMKYLKRNSGPNGGMTMSKQRRQSTTTPPRQPLTTTQKWFLPIGPQGAPKKKVAKPHTAVSS